MKVSAITSLIVALAAVASATPLEERGAAPQEDVRAQAGVTTATVYTDPNFHGQSRPLQKPQGQCGTASILL